MLLSPWLFIRLHKRNIYKRRRRIDIMVYTEIKEKGGKKYYYRVVSVRKGEKVEKKKNLSWG